MRNLFLVMGLCGLVGCATAGQSTEEIIREVNLTADRLEEGLLIAEATVAPAFAIVSAVCEQAGEESPACVKGNQLLDKFGEALDKAQDAVDNYRTFTGDFSQAARALAAVVEAGAEVVKAVK